MGSVRRMLGGIVVAAVSVVLAGCAASAPVGGSAMSLTVTSAEFAEGDTIPEAFTCRGAGDFPGIAWTGDLAAARALAVVVDDPDAPGGTYVHLVVLDLAADTTSLTPALGGTVALNSDGTPGWTPPCPPSGEHHYRFTVYGLSAPTGLGASATPADATAAISAVKVAQGTLTGLVAAE